MACFTADAYSVFYRFSGNFSKQMKRVSNKCLWALIYGAKEQEKQEIILKNLQNGEQFSLPVSQLKQELNKYIKPLSM